jgi:hypothetical protein
VFNSQFRVERGRLSNCEDLSMQGEGSRAATAPAVDVWQLSADVQELFLSAADLYDGLFEDRFVFDADAEQKKVARQAVGWIESLVKLREGIRERQALFLYFALAYDDQLHGYVICQDRYSYWRPGDDDAREPEVDPLPYRFVSYHEKAVVLIDELLEPLTADGIANSGELATIAEAVPYVLELTRSPTDLASEFVASLKKEAIRAAQLCTAEVGGLSTTTSNELQGCISTATTPVRKKKSTQSGEATAKLIAALTTHHQYENGSCLNPNPIGANLLSRLAGVSEGSASSFFTKKFGGHGQYKLCCRRDIATLAASLKLLNGEVAPKCLSLPLREDAGATCDDSLELD